MSGLKGIVAHWAVTRYKADSLSRQHYHFIYEGDGTEVPGVHKPEDNISARDGKYAAHTRGCNTGFIGVSCAAMHGAKSVDQPGGFPITPTQFDAMCRGMARLCMKYGIPVTDKTVLSHAEVESNLGVKQRGKWDIAVLPFLKLKTAKACGDEMRRRVRQYMGAGIAAGGSGGQSTKPKVADKNLYDGLPHPEILAVQKRLDELGYPEVGSFDGRWGSKTRAAVLAFKADNDLPTTPVIDGDLWSVLMTAGKRKVAPQRAMATLADLRADDAKDVKTADTMQITGGIAGVGGLLGVASPLLEQAEGASGIMRRVVGVIDPFKSILQDNFWLVLLGVGVIVVWQSGVLKRIRLEKHRDGRDVSV